MEFITTILNQYVMDPKFVQACAVVFLTLDALQEIKAVDTLSGQWKKLSALVLGIGVGLLFIEPSMSGAVAGFFAGAATTLTLDRINLLMQPKPTA